MVFVPLGLELPPLALPPPCASLTPPVLELERAVTPPEADAPPLTDEIDDAPPTEAPPAEISLPASELEPLHATNTLQTERENPKQAVFMSTSIDCRNARGIVMEIDIPAS